MLLLDDGAGAGCAVGRRGTEVLVLITAGVASFTKGTADLSPFQAFKRSDKDVGTLIAFGCFFVSFPCLLACLLVLGFCASSFPSSSWFLFFCSRRFLILSFTLSLFCKKTLASTYYPFVRYQNFISAEPF